jgi:glucokinase
VGVPFAERLAARLRAPVRLISGVNAAARAEALSGAAAGRSPLLYVHLGRTVECALVAQCEPLIGAHGDEGRLHHWQTGRDGPQCVCGAQGHLGALVSAQALVRLAIGVASHDDETLAAVHRVTHGRAESLTAPQLVALASQGVRSLRELVDYAVDALAGALANLTVALDPAVTLVGGPLALADEQFFVWLRERVAVRLGDLRAAPDIGRASLGARAAVIGAASLAAG